MTDTVLPTLADISTSSIWGNGDIQDLKSADEGNEKIMWLTEEEFEDFLHRMRKKPVRSRGMDPEEKYRRDRAVVYLLTYAGLRVEELSNLKLTDLDLI